mgnify:CR=1 FL=1
MRYRPRIRKWTVRAEWMRLHPRKDMKFWMAVSKRVRERNVRHADLSTIKAICEELDI